MSQPRSGQTASCRKWTVSAGHLPSPCRTTSAFAYSDHAFCELDRGWGTCAVPQCTDLALLPCPFNVTVHRVTSTELQLNWPKDNPLDLLVGTENNRLRKLSGFVVTLGNPPKVPDRGSTCVRGYLIRTGRSTSWDPQKSTFVEDLLHTCDENRVLSDYDDVINVFFDQLTQNQSYEIYLTPFDVNGRIGGTQLRRISTLAAAPCAPDGVTLARVESRALTLNWTVPRGSACGLPSEVLLHYYADSLPIPEPLKLSLDTSTRLAHLIPCQRYCIRVQFVNEVGAGNMSREVCALTTRPPFTRPPIVTHRLSPPNMRSSSGHFDRLPSGSLQWIPDEFVTCHLVVRLEYTSSCPVRYEVLFGVYNSSKSDCVKFDQNVMSIANSLQLGLLYRLRVRALSGNYLEKLGTPCGTVADNNHLSPWSAWTDVFTGTGQIKLSNLSVQVQSPTLMRDLTLCVHEPVKRSSSDTRGMSLPVIESRVGDLCLQVRWDMDGRPRGLIGVIVLVFGEATVPNTHNPTADRNDKRLVSPCIKAIWVPCRNCLGPYSLLNAHHTVWVRLAQLLNDCGELHMQVPRTVDQPSTVPPNSLTNDAISTEMLTAVGQTLGAISISPMSVNQTTVDLMINISGTVDFASGGLLDRVRRGYSGDSGNTDGTLMSIKVDRGETKFYAVSAGDVFLLTEYPWYLNVPTKRASLFNSVAWAGLIFVALILLAGLLWLLVAFDAKRRRRLRHSNLQRVVDYRVPGAEDDEAVFELEAKQPIIPPRISKFLLRQPDPISVHDFVSWYEKQKYGNFTAFREEFKWLAIHSVRQEQAKRLTHHVGQLPVNRLRNKYRNLVPFDHNYVRLAKPWRLVDINPMSSQNPVETETQDHETNKVTTSPTNGTQPQHEDNTQLVDDFGPEQWIASDYVNASLIPGRAPCVAYCLVAANLLPRTYIAAQAPVSHTKGVFWQMIWDHGVKLIVLLTRLRENSKEKCVHYWPGDTGEAEVESSAVDTDSKTLKLSHFTIKTMEVVKNPIYVKRKFIIFNSLAKKSEPRAVTQLHMLCWPDFSAPTNANFTSFQYAYWTERRCCAGDDAPVLVHCSAGIGRTGTFICLDQLCQQVRYYLQPDFENLSHSAPPTLSSSCMSWEEPVYVNVKMVELDETAAKRNTTRLSNGTEYPLQSSTVTSTPTSFGDGGANTEIPDEAGLAVRQTLLRNGDTRLAPRKRRFGLGRRKSNCIDVYKTVLWLRSNRSYMVQSEDQYLFIYQYLSYFIQKLNDSDQIYANI